jgi:hypothetical protein
MFYILMPDCIEFTTKYESVNGSQNQLLNNLNSSLNRNW